MGVNLATQITLIRIFLTPLFLIFFIRGEVGWAVGIFSIAAFTDALDGYIARHHNQKTSLGSVLDPLADKLLIMTAFIGMLFRYPHLLIFLIPVISRDMILVVGSLLIFLFGGKVEIEPSISGKITTFFQLMMVIVTLGAEVFKQTLFIYSNFYLVWVVLTMGLTVVSGVGYLAKGIAWLQAQTTK